MKKAQLISKLCVFAENDEKKWRGQKPFAQFFAAWLEKLDIPFDAQYDFWDIDSYIPQLVVDAYEDLRTSDTLYIAQYRKEYVDDVERAVPNLTELGKSPVMEQIMTIQITAFLLDKVTGNEYIRQAFSEYANAQNNTLAVCFDKFLRNVYRRGMYDLIQKTKERGMGAQFAHTSIRTFVCAGRVMITFACPQNPTEQELSVSFVLEEGDPVALSGGLQSVYANLHQSMNMIEDVISGWPSSIVEQKKLFKVDKKINFGYT